MTKHCRLIYLEYKMKLNFFFAAYDFSDNPIRDWIRESLKISVNCIILSMDILEGSLNDFNCTRYGVIKRCRIRDWICIFLKIVQLTFYAFYILECETLIYYLKCDAICRSYKKKSHIISSKDVFIACTFMVCDIPIKLFGN